MQWLFEQSQSYVGLSKNINIFKYILIISKYYNTLRQGHIVSSGAYGVLQYDTIRLQYDTGVVFNHIYLKEPTVWHFGCNTPKGLLTSAPASIVPIGVLQIP